MSDRISRTVRSKKKNKKLKQMFLLTSKNCWLVEEQIVPLYQHLVDGYSNKLREEWDMKAEDETNPQVKQESVDDYLLESRSVHLNNSTNQFKVIIPLLFSSFGRIIR